jgi:hypothetical protein
MKSSITRSSLNAAVLLVLAALLSASGAAQQQKGQVTVPAGTQLLVRMVDSVDSSKSQPGARFAATLETNLQADGRTVAARGTTVYGRLAELKSAGRMTGKSELRLELTEIVIGGTAYPILTGEYGVKGSSSGKRSARRIGGGAGLGAAIGAIAGNAGKGAAIGAVTGTVGAVVQKGEKVKVPSETLLEFRLLQPAALPARG